MRKPRSKEWEADLDPFDQGRPGSYAARKAIEAIHGKARHPDTDEHGRPGSYAAARAIESIDADAEHEHWRRNYQVQPYCPPGTPFEFFETAFQVGYEGRERYPGHTFDEVEGELAAEYERRADANDPPWAQVREAARSAWDRCTQRHDARA